MWLLESKTRELMEKAVSDSIKPSAEQQKEYLAFFGDEGTPGDRILSVAGDVAEIKVHGVLTKNPDFFAWLFGGGNTTYSDIIGALAQADANPNVKSIVLDIDSPGGTVAGLFDVLGALQSTKKPIKTFVSGMAASAAFAIASQGNEIEASNVAVTVGSIGVIVSQHVDPDELTLTSTKAPLKNMDLSTPEGKQAIQEHLDALHDLFVGAIADGRGTTAERVNTEFGRGSVVLATPALNCGMIDCISGGSFKIKAIDSNVTKKTEAKAMDLSQLKTEHAGVYAEAVSEGVKQERDRVTAHLIMGEASKEMKIATKAIRDGEGMTATLNAEYSAAGMKNTEIEARTEDDAAGEGATDNPDTSADDLKENTLEKETLALMDKNKKEAE